MFLAWIKFVNVLIMYYLLCFQTSTSLRGALDGGPRPKSMGTDSKQFEAN